MPPDTREVLLQGLQKALQERVVGLWSNVTQAGEPTPGPRFAEGLHKAIMFYDKAWQHIMDVTADE